MKIIGMIPARIGSQRVKQKNLRLLDGKPLIQYAIQAAQDAHRLTDVYVNSESDAIGQVAIQQGIKFYKRPPELGSDTTMQDEFCYDFMKAIQPDILVMINPASPLVEGRDIDQMVAHFLEHSVDTLIASHDVKMHAVFQNNPVNFSQDEQLQRTQDLKPVSLCSWAVSIWRADTFIKQYRAKGHAAFSGKIGFYPLDRFKALKISTNEDFVLAEIYVQFMHRWKFPLVPYDSAEQGAHYPTMWMSEIHAIEELLDEQASQNKFLNILEWGGGSSTVYFSKYLKEKGIRFKWTAMENFIPWHQKVTRMIQDHHLSDTTEYVLKNGTCEERKYLQETFDMDDYVNYPATMGVRFNLIIVDGRRRLECLGKAKDLLAEGGVTVLHDAERPAYHGAFAHYENGGEFICENKSPVPGGVQKLWVGHLPDHSRQTVSSGRGPL